MSWKSTYVLGYLHVQSTSGPRKQVFNARGSVLWTPPYRAFVHCSLSYSSPPPQQKWWKRVVRFFRSFDETGGLCHLKQTVFHRSCHSNIIPIKFDTVQMLESRRIVEFAEVPFNERKLQTLRTALIPGQASASSTRSVYILQPHITQLQYH